MAMENDTSEAMKYVKSLNDASKRHFAIGYLAWVRNGREGNMPDQGPLSQLTARTVARTIDRLA
jgi:hypothetical protein